jgi:hypothetical protein
MSLDDPFDDLSQLRIAPDGITVERRVARPARRIKKRRENFVMKPWPWVEKLTGAPGKTHTVADHLLHLDWRNHHKPFELPNGMLKIDGISRASKWRALADLERRGLISIERRPRQSPIVRVHLPRFRSEA